MLHFALVGTTDMPAAYTSGPVPPLAGLMSRPQWVVWKLEQIFGETKPRKVPYDPKSLKTAKANAPTTWGSFEQAHTICTLDPAYRLGFEFTADDPYLFIDIDGCRNPETGEWTPETQAICAMFPGVAMEVSQSGTGLHIVGRVSDKAAFTGKRKPLARRVRVLSRGPFHGAGEAS